MITEKVQVFWSELQRGEFITDAAAAAGTYNSRDLLAFFVRRAESPEDAAVLLGDALLIIWRWADSIPSDDLQARMWMFGVARNLWRLTSARLVGAAPFRTSDAASCAGRWRRPRATM